jgi:uncharacterized RmlC-like cupin family protein
MREGAMTLEANASASSTHGFRLVKAADRTVAANQTPGMVREEAVQTGDMWAGVARTAPGMISGWHHHGAWKSVIYVLEGAIRIDFGAGGHSSLLGEAGDYLFIPAGEIHRESNPSAVEQVLVVVRTGSGPVVINVDEPAS